MPEFRRDPIIGRWVIISTDRGKRPHDFIAQPVQIKTSGCPFCNGFESKTPAEVFAFRSKDSKPNEPGWQIRVVPNKFPALSNVGEANKEFDGMYRSINGIGVHEIFIETPKHATEIEELPLSHVELILQAYRSRMKETERDTRIRYILIFKNVGQRAGASLSHAHSQLIALPMVPKRIREECNGAWNYYNHHQKCVFCDILDKDLREKERIVYKNDKFVAICPYASRFPFETWILPLDHSAHFHHSDTSTLSKLAEVLKETIRKLNVTLERPQYNYLIHTGPVRFHKADFGKTLEKDFHWHIEIIPRLTYTAGFEWGTGFYINPTPPEQAAAFLRESS